MNSLNRLMGKLPAIALVVLGGIGLLNFGGVITLPGQHAMIELTGFIVGITFSFLVLAGIPSVRLLIFSALWLLIGFSGETIFRFFETDSSGPLLEYIHVVEMLGILSGGACLVVAQHILNQVHEVLQAANGTFPESHQQN